MIVMPEVKKPSHHHETHEHLNFDTHHEEQNDELHKLLFPDGEFLFNALKFSVSYNKVSER